MQRNSILFAAVVTGLTAVSAFAAPIEPPAWVRDADPLATATAEKRTYQQWDVFGSVAGPNAPTIGAPVAPVTFFTAGVNPNGVANAFSTVTAGVFTTGGGNIYSPTATIAPRAIVPLPALDGVPELVTLDIRVLGTGINTASITANGAAVSTLPNYSLQTFSAGEGMGASFGYTVRFTTPDATSLQVDYTAAGSSSSLDVLAIATQSTSAVPEPAALAVLGLAAGAVLRRRRSR